MFMLKSKKSNVSNDLGSNEMNHIAAGTKVVGDITTKGNFRLDGELQGNLISESRVVLGKTSSLTGSLKSQNADISGVVKGIVEVTDQLVLTGSANLQADIVTGSLEIESGAIFNGVTKMGASAKDGFKNESKKS